MIGFIVFYCLTGVLLNHRKYFAYFIDKKVTQLEVPKSNIEHLRGIINFYKKQIGRSDDPTVIRIRGSDTLEFLYGSHGKVTYVIHPISGKMEVVEKAPYRVIRRLNDLHKAFHTQNLWLLFSDALTILLLVVVFSGLFIFRYGRLDYLFLLSGIIFVLLILVWSY